VAEATQGVSTPVGAREWQAESLADEVIMLADAGVSDPTVDARILKVQIEARNWLAS